MFLSFLAAEATEDQIDLVKWITIGVLLLLVIVILLLSTIGKKQRLDTKTMVFAAICISTSFDDPDGAVRNPALRFPGKAGIIPLGYSARGPSARKRTAGPLHPQRGGPPFVRYL